MLYNTIEGVRAEMDYRYHRDGRSVRVPRPRRARSLRGRRNRDDRTAA